MRDWMRKGTLAGALAWRAIPAVAAGEPSAVTLTFPEGRLTFVPAPMADAAGKDPRPLSTRQLTRLRVTLADARGAASAACRLTDFAAEMPAHKHGMNVVPRITSGQKLGEYLVDGVKLHMPGRWELTFTVVCGAGKPARATFVIEV